MPQRTRGRSIARCLSLLLPMGVVAASLFAGCSTKSDDGSEDAEANACLSNRQFFERKVWGAFMSQKCAKCHTPDGEANADKATDMVVQSASYPGFLDTNLAQLSIVARTDVDGQSKLLQKPLGKLAHGGGVQLTEDSAEYAALVEMTARLKSGTDPCPGSAVAALPAIQLLDGPSTLRKVTIDLGGRLPTDDALAAVAKPGAEGDAALDAQLDALMTEEVFYDRLREMFNDLLLTDRFLEYGGAMVDAIDDKKLYPGLTPYKNGCDTDECKAFRYQINRGIAREPLELIRYVVRNDRPFTEILTASYALVNPYMAKAYGVDPGFSNPADPNEYKEAQVSLGTGIAVPHAGLLSTPAFLNRWPTTPTNRSRGRARRVFSFFLATDILKIAERPVDASSITQVEIPTMNSSACTTCHRVIDPVAGGFRGYDPNSYEDFDPNKEYDSEHHKWYADMFPPGYAGADMPSDAYSKGLPWLAQQLTTDPRFVISAVNTVYTGLTGHKPLAYPTDPAAPDYGAKLTAWGAQDAFFRTVGEEFKQSNFNIKVVFKALLKSPYYRAAGVAGDVPADQQAVLADVGTGRFLTPEVLNRKITAITGAPWRKQYEWNKQHDWLAEDFVLLYGGTDSNNAPVRLTDPNGIAASVAWRMANEVACHITAYDFTKPKDQRRFFPMVEANEQPELAGHPVDGSIASIRANLVHMYKLFLGQTLDPADPEIERALQLYVETFRELQAAGKEDIEYECQGRIDPASTVDPPTELPKDQQITKDKNFTIRSWMAVTTYLLLDWKFLYQ
jgi:hypothetical protein